MSSIRHEDADGAPGHHAHDSQGGRHDEHAHHGHGEHPSQPSGGGHEHHHAVEFRRRFWISLALAVPVIAFSPMIRDWLGLPDVTGVQEAVAPVFGTILFFYGGRPFLAGAVSNALTAKGRAPSHIETVEAHLRVHLAPHFGSRPIDRIDEHDVTRLIAKLTRDGKAPKIIKNIVGPFTRCSISRFGGGGSRGIHVAWSRSPTFPR